MMQILKTDTKFLDSPAVGEPECLCSRCGKPILRGVPLRAWPNDMTEDPATQWEYRYHNACQGLNPELDRSGGPPGC